jgi:hypothetical protein
MVFKHLFCVVDDFTRLYISINIWQSPSMQPTRIPRLPLFYAFKRSWGVILPVQGSLITLTLEGYLIRNEPARSAAV